MPSVITCVYCLVSLIVGTSSSEYSNEWVLNAYFDETDAKLFSEQNGYVFVRKLFINHFLLDKPDVPSVSKMPAEWVTTRFQGHPKVKYLEQQQWQRRVLKSPSKVHIEDPEWTNMWYLHDNKMQVEQAWNEGYTGKHITIGIVDSGVDYNHPDLKANYDPAKSIDVYDGNKHPLPEAGDSHGTKSTGVASAVKNKNCVVGVAFDSKFAGVRLIGPRGTTDIMEYDALSLRGIDISSNSWGAVEREVFSGPGKLAEKGIEDATNNGRNGLGTIFLMAGGNGGPDDNCNCDGYANNIHTIAINAVSSELEPPGYAEPCTAILASAFSGGGLKDVSTTDLHSSCTNSFEGTSAATPMAAGIIALLLQANIDLTWRDVQHIIVATSNTTHLKYGDFQTNGVGRAVSDLYGFGILSASDLIDAARNWTLVPGQHICVEQDVVVGKTIQVTDISRVVSSTLSTIGCNGSSSTGVQFLEHVQVWISFDYTKRGTVHFTLTSPAETKSKLLTRRQYDISSNGNQEWTFMSVQHWGENPNGNWTLEMSIKQDPLESGTLNSWRLTLYGTHTDPALGRINDPDMGTTTDSLTETGILLTSSFPPEASDAVCSFPLCAILVITISVVVAVTLTVSP